MLVVSLLEVGTVLRRERDSWSMVRWLRQATSEYAPPLPRYSGKALSECLFCGVLMRARVGSGAHASPATESEQQPKHSNLAWLEKCKALH